MCSVMHDAAISCVSSGTDAVRSKPIASDRHQSADVSEIQGRVLPL